MNDQHPLTPAEPSTSAPTDEQHSLVAIPSSLPIEADAKFLLAHPAYFFALGFGAGLSPKAPGTVGTLLAWLIFYPLQQFLGEWGLAVWVVVAFIVGIPICQKTGRALCQPDARAMVWDEMAAFWLVLLLAPETWMWQLVAFILFRLFDIAKPAPIWQIDRAWKNGLGVMADDLIAAGYALFFLAVFVRLFS